MQRWEYLVVQLGPNQVVTHVNGVPVAREVKGKYGTEYIGESMFDFMKRIGYEGWELVGAQSVGERVWLSWMFFKRPAP